MNRSFRSPESQMLLKPSLQRRTMTKEKKEEELALFMEMRKLDKETSHPLHQDAHESEASLGSKHGSSPAYKTLQYAPTRKTPTDDFLNSENDKNDYDWLLTPPGTPLFSSLEMDSQKTIMSRIGTTNHRPTSLKSRLTNVQLEPASKSNLVSRQSTLSPGLHPSNAGARRPSSSGGAGTTSSRSATPTGRPTRTTTSKASRPSTPTSGPSIPSYKSVPPARSKTPVRSSTPTSRLTTQAAKPSITSSKTTISASKSMIPASKSTSRSSTPTRRPSTPSSVSNLYAPGTSFSVARSGPTPLKNPVPSRGSSPTVKSRPWKPSDMPGFSLEAPPNLRTSMPDRPLSASRGRLGVPSARSSSVEVGSTGRPRRQSCSPLRGRAPTGSLHSSGSSVPAVNRVRTNSLDHVSPVQIGNNMVERVVNMRKLAPPKKDDNQCIQNNLTGKPSPDSKGFGRTLSKKSLDMALRHMDIRRIVPGGLCPLMTNIPASSMYSVRSGPVRSRMITVSDSPLATSSNASSGQSVNYNALCFDGSELDDGDRDPPLLGDP